MAAERGPGEGYHAAKQDALTLRADLKCRAVYYAAHDGARREIVGYVVEDGAGRTLGRARLSRDAWADAYFQLGGSFVSNPDDTP